MILFSQKYLNKNRIKTIFFLFILLIIIIFNPYILKYFSNDRNLHDSTVNFILLCDSFLLLCIFTAYLFFYKKKILKKITTFFIIINITLLPIFLIYVTEGFFQFYRINKNFIDESDSIAAHFQTFSNKYIPIKLYENLPDVYMPVKSEHLNINNQGFRTYDFNKIEKKENEVTILLLGGSTAFGYNIADKNTISKQLERIHNQNNKEKIKVYSLAMNNFRFYDEVNTVKIFIEIIKPEKIIFYHGINDMYVEYEKIIKYSKNNSHFKNIDELNYFEKKTLIIKEYFKRKVFYMILSTYYKKIFPYNINIDFIEYENLINNYANENYKKLYKDLNESICNKKECFFFIQPVILHKKNKTFYEEITTNNFISNYPLFDKIYNYYFDIILSQNKKNICDLREIFINTKKNIFFDEVHVNSTGNLIIAEKIYNTTNEGSCTY